MAKRHFITEDSVPYISEKKNYISCEKCNKKYVVLGFSRTRGEGWKQITSENVKFNCSCMDGVYRFDKRFDGNGDYQEYDNLSLYEVPEKINWTITTSDSIKDFWSDLEPELEELPTDKNIFRDFISGRKSGQRYSSGF